MTYWKISASSLMRASSYQLQCHDFKIPVDRHTNNDRWWPARVTVRVQRRF